MKKIMFTSLVWLLLISVSAQVDLDSLWGVWNDETKSDSNRMEAMRSISWDGYLYSHPDSAFYFAQYLYDFARIKNDKHMMAKALRIQGASYYVRYKNDSAMAYYHRSIDMSEEVGDKRGMAIVLQNIGIIYNSEANYPEALEYLLQSGQLYEELNDKNGVTLSLRNAGAIYIHQGSYLKAIANYERCLKINEEIASDEGIAQSLVNLGTIYEILGNYEKAMEYYQRSLDENEKVSDKKSTAGVLNNIGNIYSDQYDDSSAMAYYTRSLKIYEDLSDKHGIALVLNNIGHIYSRESKFDTALLYYQQSLDIKEEISDAQGTASSMTSIGRMKFRQGEYADAVSWCEKGLLLAEQLKVLENQKNACVCLYDTYKAWGKIEKALEYHERIAIIEDSLKAEETSKKLQQMEFSKQILADSLLQEEEKLRVQLANEAIVRKKNRTRNIFIISAMFLLIGAVGLYRRVVFVRRAKKEIENEKERSDKLLLNILPEEIAEELKTNGKAAPRRFDTVSILFTDFKGFTKISEQLSAEILVSEISEFFESFDSICKKYRIEKIKTIGDSFMAAGGIPVPYDEAVKNTVLAGLEMLEFIQKMKKEYISDGKMPFEMRIGIHSGPVVAGIVGVSKFQYDIWGDTVNTASRIELAGEVGRVNISDSTYKLIKDDPDFVFTARGKVQTKGKGEIEMWFVEKAR